jgi:hypothetical protein
MDLTKVFPPVQSARSLLVAAGFPEEALPVIAESALEYWERISVSIAKGVLPVGRQKVLAEALSRYPANGVFLAASAALRPDGFRVLVVGASPRGVTRIRWDRELKAITEANRGHLTVESCPAASIMDLRRIREFRPNLLHLACHGVGENLIFEDSDGEQHAVPAVDIVDTLRLARTHTGVRLAGILLRSCGGDAIADRFTEISDVVVAHRGALHDTCAMHFAGHFYAELAERADLLAAAELAARDTANLDHACRSISTNLILRPSFKG